MEFQTYYQELLENIELPDETEISSEQREKVRNNYDVELWLNDLSEKTQTGYMTYFCYFLNSVNIEDPSELLNFKKYEDRSERFFPAEDLVEVWKKKAKDKGLKQWRIKRVIDSVRSFFKYRRVPLINISVSYKPQEKKPLSEEDLRKFRRGMNFISRTIFDFLISVPLRSGQFKICNTCGQEFYPRWRHIDTYPEIKKGSAFIIRPEKGHSSENYSSNLRQCCFLTQTCANSLNEYRDLKERELERKLRPDEPIFTHSKSTVGIRHVSPMQTQAVEVRFKRNSKRTNVKIYPHLLRSWVNSRLAACGIDKLVRDIYLGHSTSYEQNYIMQLKDTWRQKFLDSGALDSLDPFAGSDRERIKEMQSEIAEMKEKVKRSQEMFKRMTSAILGSEVELGFQKVEREGKDQLELTLGLPKKELEKLRKQARKYGQPKKTVADQKYTDVVKVDKHDIDAIVELLKKGYQMAFENEKYAVFTTQQVLA